ncbi:MAG TPA: thioesterase family protein [Thermoplasmata archaeon]|nr:thioesterase family protein [Thermoplasmata archaeon]
MARFTVQIQMRFRDLDAMGHVNNAVYLTYCELARTQFYLRHAFKRSLHDIDFILAHVDMDYASAAEWGDEVEVSVWPSKIGESSFTLSYELRDNKSGRVLATSSSVQVAYDYDKKKTKPIPPDFRKMLEKNLEA